jgi:hypothetical protein
MTPDTTVQARHSSCPLPWAGVTDGDKPVIGWSVIPAFPALAYLADPEAVRLADEQELAAYPHLYAAYGPWMSVASLAEEGNALAAKILTAPMAHAVGPVPAASPVPVIPFGPVAGLAADRIAEDTAARAQEAARASLNRWAGPGQGEPSGIGPDPGSPEAQAAFLEVSNQVREMHQDAAAGATGGSAETTIMPAIPAATEGEKS